MKVTQTLNEMACKRSARLKKLVNVCLREELFFGDVSTAVFLSFLEVLKNLKNKKFKNCFSEETKKKARKHKKIMKRLLNPDIREKKRKKLLKKSSKKFQDFCYNFLLKDFFEKCLE